MKDILKVSQLTKSFGQFLAVNNVSFSIRKGEMIGLLGPNGAGKTTIIQMLLGLMTPTEGDIFYFSLSLAKEREKILKKHSLSCKKRKNKHIVLLPETLVARFLADLGKHGIEYSEIEIIHPSLEDFFLSTIKKGTPNALA